MTRIQRAFNIVGVVLPFVAVLVAIPLLWNDGVGAVDLVTLAVMYVVTGLGVTAGYHRLFTHRAYDAPKPVQYALAAAGSMAVQGPLADWVADHRKHHAHTDVEGDPHSPHVGHGSGLKGLWYAHTGWLFDTQGQAERRRYAADIMDDARLKWISKRFVWLVLASLAIPFAVGLIAYGDLAGGLQTLLWGGLVRIFFVHHVTWSVNSVCHFFGTRRFDLADRSTNVSWLAIPSFGESWHHNHHAFPRSAAHGLRARELDVTGAFITVLERLGLARNVVRISPERQRARELAASAAAAMGASDAAGGERSGEAEREPVGAGS